MFIFGNGVKKENFGKSLVEPLEGHMQIIYIEFYLSKPTGSVKSLWTNGLTERITKYSVYTTDKKP